MISVGIDVSKDKSTVCVIKTNGEIIMKPFEMKHTVEEIGNLADVINSFDDEVRVVLEETGHYHLPIVTYLCEKGIFICCINVLRMKKFCSQNIRKAKTDIIDAKKIAQFGITYWNELKPFLPADKTYDDLRFLARQYDSLTSTLVKLKVDLSNLLDEIMPGITNILEDNRGRNKLTEFVKEFVHFENILILGEKKFSKKYCAWATKKGYHQNERKAAQIYALAQTSIPSRPFSAIVENAVKDNIALIQQVNESRTNIITQIREICKTLPEYSLLIEMPGVGETLAPRLIAEIGDVRRFKNKHSLIAYAGIDAPPYQSGAFSASERHISKRGNSYLRKTAFELMLCLIQHKPVGDPVYDFIQKKRSEGKAAKEAMVAGINKFLRIYYGKVTELYNS